VRILMTNNTLDLPAGTELNIRDMAVAMAARGHQVAAYSDVLGEVARQIRDAGVAVFDDIRRAPWEPDVIHGHHHMETMTAILRFRASPAIYFARGFTPWEEAAPLHPRILRYAAVDEPTMEANVRTQGVPSERSHLIYNYVNSSLFRTRGEPLPPRPRRALVLSHYVSPEGADIFRLACKARGISLDALGRGAGKVIIGIERVLPDYDLVFSKGRSAFEAIGVGAALIPSDVEGVGPIVTRANLTSLYHQSFGSTTFHAPLSVDAILAEIDRYDATEARAVSLRLHEMAPMEKVVDQLLELYTQAIAEFTRSRPDPQAEAQAEAAYLAWLSLSVKHRYGTVAGERDALAAELSGLLGQPDRISAERDRLTRERFLQVAELVRARNSLVGRTRAMISGIPIVGDALRGMVRKIRAMRQ
jgi:hypothetical protein